MILGSGKLSGDNMTKTTNSFFKSIRQAFGRRLPTPTSLGLQYQKNPLAGSDMDARRDVYSGGYYTLLKKFEKSQKPYIAPLSYLPAVDCDLNALMLRIVSAPDARPETIEKALIERKHLEFQKEFQGRSMLLYVHAMLIANLRRNAPPPEILSLYIRLWQEKGNWLAKELNIRWRISAATTFADHGVTLEQRALGMGLSILFDSIKLHESERRLTGTPADVPFQRNPDTAQPDIAFDMQPFSINLGDLDRNMLARLWALAESDAVIFPLARSMLMEIMIDRRTVFARLKRLRVKIDPALETEM